MQVAFSPPTPLVMLPHALEPAQSTVTPPAPVVMSPHAEPPVHVALPPPAPKPRMLQLALPEQWSMHVPPVHAMSLHAWVVPLPSHSTVHVPAAQLMSWHASGVEQVMSHDSDVRQWMSWHAPALVHPIVQ